MTPNELIEAAKAKLDTTSTGLADRLKVSKGTLSDWKRGRWPIPPRLILELATLAELDEPATLANLTAAQTRPEEPETVRAAWAEIARRAAAASVALTLVTSSTLGPGTETSADNVSNVEPLTGPFPRRKWVRRRCTRLWGWIPAAA